MFQKPRAAKRLIRRHPAGGRRLLRFRGCLSPHMADPRQRSATRLAHPCRRGPDNRMPVSFVDAAQLAAASNAHSRRAGASSAAYPDVSPRRSPSSTARRLRRPLLSGLRRANKSFRDPDETERAALAALSRPRDLEGAGATPTSRSRMPSMRSAARSSAFRTPEDRAQRAARRLADLVFDAV